MGVIREIQEDLEAAARRLFKEYHSQLLAEARALCADADSAEDLVMITLETYFAKPEKFDPAKGELMTWLKAVMRNHFRKSLRRKSHIDTIFLPSDDLQSVADLLQAGEALPESEETESDELIRRAVASLSPKVRDAVILHYFKGRSVDKTATALGISVEAAKNRLFCARQILHQRLKGRLGKSLAVLAALLLGVTALFGAYQAGLLGEVEKMERGEPSASVSQGGAAVPAAQNEKAISNEAIAKFGRDGVPSPSAAGGGTPALPFPQGFAIASDYSQENATQQTDESANQEQPTMKLTQTFAAAALAVTAAVVTVEADGITLESVSAKQRYPWNGLVDIDYTITYDNDATLDVDDNLEVLMVNHDVEPAVTNNANVFLQAPLPLTEGSHRITWDANADGVTSRIDKAEFVLKLRHYSEAYMVIDVSGGSATNCYPVDFLNGAPVGGFNAPEYKGNKIVLRRIRPGSYVAGSPGGERNHAANEKQHRVALTQPFYIGLFEVTQRQYYNVTGSNLSSYRDDSRWHCPVDKVTWNQARGGTWPNGTPAPDSFMGKLISKCKSKDPLTGVYTNKVEGFDLPTEAQWEYACRAGTTGAFSTTNEIANTDEGQKAVLNELGRYSGNQNTEKDGITSAYTIVGSYLPNPWGLYDMHGNVSEWCRDLYIDDPTTLNPQQYKDPVGPSSGIGFVYRGGNFSTAVGGCRSAAGRTVAGSTFSYANVGFRLSRNLP